MSEDRTCPECSGPMKERTNRTTGEVFLGCSDYPKCRGTRPLDDVDDGLTDRGSQLPSQEMAGRDRRRWNQ